MKKIVLLVIAIVGGLLAYNYLTTGELRLLPGGQAESSPELVSLREDFDAAKQSFAQAGRSAGLTGMDTTFDAGAALEGIERIEKELLALKPRLTSDADIADAERLESEIKRFKGELR